MSNEHKKLEEYIGTAALLEQMAEECNELAFACLKLARDIRGENKVHGRSREEMIASVEEELADVSVTWNEVMDARIIDSKKVSDIELKKMTRMQDRLIEAEERRKAAAKAKAANDPIKDFIAPFAKLLSDPEFIASFVDSFLSPKKEPPKAPKPVDMETAKTKTDDSEYALSTQEMEVLR